MARSNIIVEKCDYGWDCAANRLCLCAVTEKHSETYEKTKGYNYNPIGCWKCASRKRSWLEPQRRLVSIVWLVVYCKINLQPSGFGQEML